MLDETSASTADRANVIARCTEETVLGQLCQRTREVVAPGVEGSAFRSLAPAPPDC